jgi:hypothetical protein
MMGAMGQSAEYPDLKFVEPNAYGFGRDGKAVRYIVIHYTAGSERSTSAEDGAAYDARRTDGTSTHYFVDSNSVVQCVLTKHRANAARHKGNRLGIQYELCGTVQTRAQWLDAASMATLRNAARQVARDCKKYGIPARRLSVAETRRAWTAFPEGPKGIVGHVDCTNAYPEDGGDHQDPGSAFPWDVFLEMVKVQLAVLNPAPPVKPAPAPVEDDMDLDDNIYGTGGASTSWTNRFGTNAPTVRNALAFAAFYGKDAAAKALELETKVKTLESKLDVIIAAVTGEDTEPA